MIRQPSIPLRLVDGLDLDEPLRAALRPGEMAHDRQGNARRLPRFFYEIPSWETAMRTQLTPHFGLWELIDVDVRETPAMRDFPRYVPCAIALLATCLEMFRQEVGAPVRVAANGGYRSPSHALSRTATPHSWGAAANIYRVGDELMDDREKIEHYSALAHELLPGVWTRPYGTSEGFAFDHVHLDLGFATVAPHDTPGEGPGDAGEDES